MHGLHPGLYLGSIPEVYTCRIDVSYSPGPVDRFNHSIAGSRPEGGKSKPNETTKPLFVDFYYFCEKKENALNFTYEYIR